MVISDDSSLMSSWRRGSQLPFVSSGSSLGMFLRSFLSSGAEGSGRSVREDMSVTLCDRMRCLLR